jgi:hypothetical protein
MFKKLGKKLFGGDRASSAEGFFLRVRCNACGETFNLFINKSTDLAQDFTEAGGVRYFLQKEIIGARCKNLIHVRMDFDAAKKLIAKRIENGTFIDDEES